MWGGGEDTDQEEEEEEVEEEEAGQVGKGEEDVDAAAAAAAAASAETELAGRSKPSHIHVISMGYDIKWGVCERVWVSRWRRIMAPGRPALRGSVWHWLHHWQADSESD